MNIYFSPASLTFHPEEFKKDYEKAGTWPKDAVLITYADFKKYSLTAKPFGYKLGESEGFPSWVEDTTSAPQSHSLERQWRDSELTRADIEIYKVQDSDPKAVGSVSDWRSYRKTLRYWPENQNFPNKEFRPNAPDA